MNQSDAAVKKIDTIVAVSSCVVWNKDFFQISGFSFQLLALLVENPTKTIE